MKPTPENIAKWRRTANLTSDLCGDSAIREMLDAIESLERELVEARKRNDEFRKAELYLKARLVAFDDDLTCGEKVIIKECIAIVEAAMTPTPPTMKEGGGE